MISWRRSACFAGKSIWNRGINQAVRVFQPASWLEGANDVWVVSSVQVLISNRKLDTSVSHRGGGKAGQPLKKPGKPKLNFNIFMSRSDEWATLS